MNSLDLHGESYEEAEQLSVVFIEKNIDNLPVEIITGNSNDMKKIILNIANKLNLNVYPKNHYNLGCLIVNNY